MEYVDELEGISNESHCIGPECAYMPSANAVIICTDNIYQTLHHLTKALMQGCISCETCSYPELTEDHVLTSAYFKIFRIVTRNAVNKSFWRKKDCSWPPLNKYAMNIWLSSLRIRAHLSWRTEKHLHVLMHQCILWYKRNRNIFVTFQSKSLHLAA